MIIENPIIGGVRVAYHTINYALMGRVKDFIENMSLDNDKKKVNLKSATFYLSK